jgi:hypothetical protein
VRLKHSPSVVAQDIPPSRSYSRLKSIPYTPSNYMCNRCAFRVNHFAKRVCLP